jgi:hypothetical protein
MAAILAATLELLALGSGLRAAESARDVQLLNLEHGFLITTSGEALPTVATPQLTAQDGAAVESIAAGTPVRVTFDAEGRVNAVTVRPKGVLTSNISKIAAVTFIVRVPATTRPGDQIYLTSNETGWNALAIRMDRIDPLHARTIVGVPVGGTFRYLYTRGNSPTLERGANGPAPFPNLPNAPPAAGRWATPKP